MNRRTSQLVLAVGVMLAVAAVAGAVTTVLLDRSDTPASLVGVMAIVFPLLAVVGFFMIFLTVLWSRHNRN